jgi:hypothetical protein
MATWVSFPRAAKFPRVLNKFRTITGFQDAVIAALTAGSAWARKAPNSRSGKRKTSAVEVDVTAIPGVPSLRSSGTKR